MVVATMTSQDYSRSNLFKQIIASSVGSVISSFVLSPLIVTKIRFQSDLAASTSPAKVARGILRSDGITGFWAGARTSLLQSLPSVVTYMVCYEQLKGLYSKSFPNEKIFAPIVAAATSRFIAVSTVAPLELVRTIQGAGVDKSIKGVINDVYTKEGWRGFYRGWGDTLKRDVPYSVIYWGSFELLKPMFRRWQYQYTYGNSVEPASSANKVYKFATFCASATSSVIAAAFTNPFDVLKTQKQLSNVEINGVAGGAAPQLIESESIFSSKTFTGHSWNCFKNEMALKFRNEDSCCIGKCREMSYNEGVLSLYRHGGFQNGLFRGLGLRLMTVIPGGAIVVTVYEVTKNML